MRFGFPKCSLPAFLVVLSACGDGSTGTPVPVSVVVTPDIVTLDALGLTQQFSATVFDKAGKVLSGIPVTWTSGSPGVASVSAGGVATGLQRGTAFIRATAEGLMGTATLVVAPVPAALEKIAGDNQTGALSQPLEDILTLEVRDSQGNPLSGASVTFSVLAGGGSVSPTFGTTDPAGRVSATWSLGCSDESPQRVRAALGTMMAEYSATADLSLPAICQETVPDGRVTFGYSEQILAVGGDSSGLTWSLAGGALPGGFSLSPQGFLGGTPTEPGSFFFSAQVTDGVGNTASKEFGLRICEAPLALAPGETASLVPSGSEGCGFFLPSGGAGDRYRFGVLWATSNRADTIQLPILTVSVGRQMEAGVPEADPPRVQRFSHPSSRDWMEGLPQHFIDALEAEAATEAFHLRLRESEMELLEHLGPDISLLPDFRAPDRVARAPGPAPEKMTFYPNDGSKCDNIAQATAIKVAENEHIVIYQDSAQATVDSLTIDATMAEMMLDYYRDYGKPVIDTYFGGVTDVNDDGRVVVLVTPVVEEAVAYVWSGDFYPTEECNASNEMELVRFRASSIRRLLTGGYQPLGTLVHEVKHLSSLYNALARYRASGGDDSYHPGWVEEGTATMAGEISSRLAWAATGGPAVGALVRRSDKVVTPETYYMLISWGRGMFYLNSQPNGLVAVPAGAHSRHSIYGSGWHFHRWLGDAYGGAADPLADGPLFTAQNDSLSASGPTGIKDLTGKSWEELLDEYSAAIMLNGTGAPQPPRAFTSYDLPDVTSGLYGEDIQPPGLYPWPVNVTGENLSAPFASTINMGPLGPSGIRIFDLTSDGTGAGVEVKVSASRDPLRLVVVRVH